MSPSLIHPADASPIWPYCTNPGHAPLCTICRALITGWGGGMGAYRVEPCGHVLNVEQAQQSIILTAHDCIPCKAGACDKCAKMTPCLAGPPAPCACEHKPAPAALRALLTASQNRPCGVCRQDVFCGCQQAVRAALDRAGVPHPDRSTGPGEDQPS